MAKRVLKIKTDYGTYDCVFERAMDVGGYVVEAHGLKGGAFTQGRNLAEAKKMIKEAIEGMIEAEAISKAERQGIVRIKQKNLTRIA